jgi:hypothetical protein
MTREAVLSQQNPDGRTTAVVLMDAEVALPGEDGAWSRPEA